jgi:hypothetical protein
MSIPVDVAELGRTLADFGAGYLLSTTDGRVKAVSIRPELRDGVLVVRAPGRGSCANVAANPEVTALFPPLVAPGFTLLVDGAAEVDGEDVRVTPTSAVLHKSAVGADG